MGNRRLFLLLLVSALLFGGAVIYRLTTSADGATAGGVSYSASLSNADLVAKYQEDLRRNPENPAAYARLGLAYLQQVRETGDASLYGQADLAFQEALSREPQQLEALMGMGILALARHDFQGALLWAEQAGRLAPHKVEILGIIVDAQVELGQYEAAAATAQEMMNLKPGLASYSRASYIRELFGDPAGAITAMQAAVDAGAPGQEGTAWSQVQLGHLYFNQGNWDEAALSYQAALQTYPDYPYALGGLARVKAAQGQLAEAITLYESLVQSLPLPQFAIELGDLYALSGRDNDAQNQYGLVRAIQQLNVTAGINVDLELALFEADYGDPAQALQQARAAYSLRPSIYAADVLAWAFYQNGQYEEAQRYSQEALRLGTQDSLLYFHAGMIAYKLGALVPAGQYLQQALNLNPAFSLRLAPQAQAILTQLPNQPTN